MTAPDPSPPLPTADEEGNYVPQILAERDAAEAGLAAMTARAEAAEQSLRSTKLALRDLVMRYRGFAEDRDNFLLPTGVAARLATVHDEIREVSND